MPTNTKPVGGAQSYVTGTLRSDSTTSTIIPATTVSNTASSQIINNNIASTTSTIAPAAVPITALKLTTSLITFVASSLASSSSSSPSSPTPSLDSSIGSSCSSAGSTPPPAYSTICPVTVPRAGSITSSVRSTSTYSNPLFAALNNTPSKPIKPVLTARSSSDSLIDDKPSTPIDVLSTVFPKDSSIHSLPHSSVDLSEFSTAWKGTVLENASMGTRTLYVVGGSYKDVNMRESVCGVMEKAEDELACTGVVMCLEKKGSDLGELIHQLLYVGGTITNQPFAAKNSYILVGLDI